MRLHHLGQVDTTAAATAAANDDNLAQGDKEAAHQVVECRDSDHLIDDGLAG